MMSDPQIHKPDSFDEVESPCEELSPDQIRIAELEDKLLRTQAELENFRKRSRREIEENFRYREIDLLRDILPILDSVSRAIEASKKVADVESLVSGFEMTSQQVLKVLASHGCSPIQTDGKQFDPSMHVAINACRNCHTLFHAFEFDTIATTCRTLVAHDLSCAAAGPHSSDCTKLWNRWIGCC